MKRMCSFLVFIFSLSICLVCGLKVKGNENVSNLNQYYYNLNNNFSENVNGTCTFVSTAMLLSYYDTYLNDDIIPEQYDVTSTTFNESPGVYYEGIDEHENIVIYKTELLKIKAKSLQALLVAISNSFGYNTLELTSQQRITVLNYYFENIIGFFNGYEYEFNYIIDDANNQNGLRDFIKTEIDDGKPVIVHFDHYTYLSGTPFSDYSHALVAYDYDDEGVYAHYGEKNAPSYQRFNINDSNYFKLTDVFLIDFNLPHKHSNNIAMHNDTNTHKVNCPCGEIFYENHSFKIDDKCSICGYQGEIETNYQLYLDPSLQQTCGTQVKIFGGSLNNNDITVGYTRCAYLDSSAQSISRLDYDWVSYDENIAIVTQYGTILGKNSGTTVIQASLKSSPNIIARINIVVQDDTTFDIKEIEMTTDLRGREQNGTEVTLNGGVPGESTIKSGYTRALCFSNENLYPSLDHFYIVSSDLSSLIVDRYGYLCAQNVENQTSVIVNGYSRYNSQLRFTITIIIYPM